MANYTTAIINIEQLWNIRAMSTQLKPIRQILCLQLGSEFKMLNNRQSCTHINDPQQNCGSVHILIAMFGTIITLMAEQLMSVIKIATAIVLDWYISRFSFISPWFHW